MSRTRLKSNRFLPSYVSRFVGQHGKARYRFRRNGFPSGYFTAEPGTEKFREEYHAFMHPAEIAASEPAPRFPRGSIDDLVSRYFAVPERLGPSAVTQSKIRAVIEDFREGKTSTGKRIGELPAALVTFEAIDKLIAKKQVKTGVGNKSKGGIHAAKKLRKELIRLFDFAEKAGIVAKNPARLSDKVSVPVGQRTDGFHTWDEEEIEQFRAKHALGTRERLAMELILWTDQRRSDVVKMGRAQVKDGCIPVTQEKTGAVLWLPLASQLLEAIVAMKPQDTSPFCFLITKFKRPFTKESFGNFFKDACIAADLPHCSAHGLRKATLRRMADLEMANKSMKSISGQSSDKTLAIYTKKANQRRLAESAMSKLSAWETQDRIDNAEPEIDNSQTG